MKPDPNVMKAWESRSKLRAEAGKLWAEGDKLYAEGIKLRAEAGKLQAEADKLQAEGDKLRAEGNIVFLDAVIKVYGNVTVEWEWVGEAQAYSCKLGNGVVLMAPARSVTDGPETK